MDITSEPHSIYSSLICSIEASKNSKIKDRKLQWSRDGESKRQNFFCHYKIVRGSQNDIKKTINQWQKLCETFLGKYFNKGWSKYTTGEINRVAKRHQQRLNYPPQSGTPLLLPYANRKLHEVMFSYYSVCCPSFCLKRGGGRLGIYLDFIYITECTIQYWFSIILSGGGRERKSVQKESGSDVLESVKFRKLTTEGGDKRTNGTLWFKLWECIYFNYYLAPQQRKHTCSIWTLQHIPNLGYVLKKIHLPNVTVWIQVSPHFGPFFRYSCNSDLMVWLTRLTKQVQLYNKLP